MLKKALLGCGIASSVLYVAMDVVGSMRDGQYSYALLGLAGGVLFRTETREVLAAGLADGRASMHLPTLVVQTLLLLAAMAFGSTLLGRRFRWYTYGTILTLLVCGGLAGRYASEIEANMPTPGAGLIQRVNIYATLLWVAVLAVALLRTQGSPRRTRANYGDGERARLERSATRKFALDRTRRIAWEDEPLAQVASPGGRAPCPNRAEEERAGSTCQTSAGRPEQSRAASGARDRFASDAITPGAPG